MTFVIKTNIRKPKRYDERYKKWLIKLSGKQVKGHQCQRILVLALMIKSLIKGNGASPQQLGNHMEDSIDLESEVKKAKRWLTNKYTDHQLFMFPF